MAIVTLRPEGVAAVNRALHRGIREGLAPFVLAEAQRLAPVGDPATDPHAGRYRDGLAIQDGEDGTVLIVAVGAPEAIYNEFGTRFMAAHPVMTPALLTGMTHAPELVVGPMRAELG